MIDKNKLKRARDDAEWYMRHFLTIRTKSGELTTLTMKPAQQALYNTIQDLRAEGKPVRIVILKARQLGFSTVIEALFFQHTAMHRNVRTMIVAHDDDATTNLFRMNKRFFDNLPSSLKPMQTASNSREIIFDNPSRDLHEKQTHKGLGSTIRCVPATGSSVGRSDTLTNVHASEVAFWRNMQDTLTALLQAVPNQANTSVILETTPNGFNAFKDFWDMSVKGETGFTPVFFPWFMEPEYRMATVTTDWTAEELMLKKAYELDDEQLEWRRWCIANNLAGDAEKFKQEYPSCPEEAFLTSGNPFFENSKVIARLNELTQAPEKGVFVYGEDSGGMPLEFSLEPSEGGAISIYERPKERRPYVIGGDTAGDGSDRFTATVIDNTTGNQVAQLLYDGNSELFYAQQIYCLGKFYNNALVGIEINFSSYPEKKLEEWQYNPLYIREKPDDSRNQLNVYKWGWRTDMRTRPLALANLHTIVSQNIDMLYSKELLREMLTFIKNEQMRPEASEGEHDDLVMATAITYAIRNQQSFIETPEKPEEHIRLIDRIDPYKKHRR